MRGGLYDGGATRADARPRGNLRRIRAASSSRPRNLQQLPWPARDTLGLTDR